MTHVFLKLSWQLFNQFSGIIFSSVWICFFFCQFNFQQIISHSTKLATERLIGSCYNEEICKIYYACSISIDIKTRSTLYMGQNWLYTSIHCAFKISLKFTFENQTIITAAYLILCFLLIWWENNVKSFKSF